MTQAAVPSDGHAPGPVPHKPAKDHDAVRANTAALKKVRQRRPADCACRGLVVAHLLRSRKNDL
jgi:hypothetical protein